jgi:hypothetical protein
MGFEITELFAFVIVDPRDPSQDEGVMAFLDPRTKAWLPMVGADMARVESLKPIANIAAKELNASYRIKRFVYTNDL